MPIDFKGSLLLSCKVHACDSILSAQLRSIYRADFDPRQLILSYYYITINELKFALEWNVLKYLNFETLNLILTF